MNSRTKGHDFERFCATRLREIFPDVATSRFKGALWWDIAGVDLTNTGNYNFQCKAKETSPSYHLILASMPKGEHINVILHKKNNRGIVAVLDFEDFLELIKKHDGKHSRNSGYS
jgi:hypothetical protein